MKSKRLQQLKTSFRLAKRVVNPRNVYKGVKNAIRGKGIILPKTKYVGPGNQMNLGRPRGKGDAIAYQHDVDYDNYKQSRKVNPIKLYLGYSDADKRARKLARRYKHEDPAALAVYAGMSIKKRASKIGLTGKRLRDKKIYGERGVPSLPNSNQKKADEYLKAENITPLKPK